MGGASEAVKAELSRKARATLEREKVSTLWVPNVGPQTEAYWCQADELFYGGQAGGGKSALMIGLSLTCHERSLLLRRTAKEAEGWVDDYVTILGDRTIPYTALKRVMASVQAADFREVQLAIDRPSTATGKDGGAATASAVSGGGKAS